MGAVISGSLFFGALSALLTAILPHVLCPSRSTARRSSPGRGHVDRARRDRADRRLWHFAAADSALVLPLVILAWLVIGALSVLGWVALVGPFGVALLRRAGLEGQPHGHGAAVGSVALSLLRVWSIFWFTAWIGLLATALLSASGWARCCSRALARPIPPRAVPGRGPSPGGATGCRTRGCRAWSDAPIPQPS